MCVFGPVLRDPKRGEPASSSRFCFSDTYNARRDGVPAPRGAVGELRLRWRSSWPDGQDAPRPSHASRETPDVIVFPENLDCWGGRLFPKQCSPRTLTVRLLGCRPVAARQVAGPAQRAPRSGAMPGVEELGRGGLRCRLRPCGSTNPSIRLPAVKGLGSSRLAIVRVQRGIRVVQARGFGDGEVWRGFATRCNPLVFLRFILRSRARCI